MGMYRPRGGAESRDSINVGLSMMCYTFLDFIRDRIRDNIGTDVAFIICPTAVYWLSRGR